MSRYLRFSPLLILAGGVMMAPRLNCHGSPPSPVDPVAETDPLSQFHAAQRVAETDMLRQLSADSSENTQQKLDRVVALRDAIRLQTQAVYTDAIAEAVFAGTLNELADDLEGVK